MGWFLGWKRVSQERGDCSGRMNWGGGGRNELFVLELGLDSLAAGGGRDASALARVLLDLVWSAIVMTPSVTFDPLQKGLGYAQGEKRIRAPPVVAFIMTDDVDIIGFWGIRELLKREMLSIIARMDKYRFYVVDLVGQAGATGGAGAGLIYLPEDQGHHARTVLRLEVGAEVVLFDGKGGWAEGKVVEDGGKKGRGGVGVKIQGGVHVDAKNAVELTIATAIPKGDRADWLIEQASQLNVRGCGFWSVIGGGEDAGGRAED